MASDILILLVTTKLFLDLAQKGFIPQSLFVVGSILIAFFLGLNMPVAKKAIKEGISVVAIIIYLSYYFYLNKYGAPGGVVFDIYTVFVLVLFGIYLFGRFAKISILVIIAFVAIIFFGYLFAAK